MAKVLKTLKKKAQATPIVGVILDSLKSENPRQNAPSIQAVLDNLQPKQLLINPDFQINQRGKTSYVTNNNTWTYTIDMWRLRNKQGGTLTVNEDNTVTITNDGTENMYFQQMFDTPKNGTHTIVVYVVNITRNVYFNVDQAREIVRGLNIYTSEFTDRTNILINLSPDSTITLEYVDLFEGNIAYPHVKKSYQDDLWECEDKMFPLAIGSYIPIGSCTFYDGYLNIFIGKRFKDSPSVIYNGIFTVYAIENEQNLESKTITDAFYDKRVGCLKLKLSGVSFGNGKTMMIQTGNDDSSYLILTNEPL